MPAAYSQSFVDLTADSDDDSSEAENLAAKFGLDLPPRAPRNHAVQGRSSHAPHIPLVPQLPPLARLPLTAPALPSKHVFVTPKSFTSPTIPSPTGHIQLISKAKPSIPVAATDKTPDDPKPRTVLKLNLPKSANEFSTSTTTKPSDTVNGTAKPPLRISLKPSISVEEIAKNRSSRPTTTSTKRTATGQSKTHEHSITPDKAAREAVDLSTRFANSLDPEDAALLNLGYPDDLPETATQDRKGSEKKEQAQAKVKVPDVVDRRMALVATAMKVESISPSPEELNHLRSLIEHVGRGAFHGGPYDAADDELIVYLKERGFVSWPTMIYFFPGRNTWHSLQSRYSSKLKEDYTISRPWMSGRKLKRPPPASIRDDASSSPERMTPVPQGPPRRSSRLERTQPARMIFHTEEQNDEQLKTALPKTDPTDVAPQFTMPKNERQDAPRVMVQNMSMVGDTRQFENPERLYTENVRDIAALTSMTSKLPRAPLNRPIPSTQHNNNDGQHRVQVRKRRSIEFSRPYLDSLERQFLNSCTSVASWDEKEIINWDGKILHVDFLDQEIEQLLASIQAQGRYVPLNDGSSLRSAAVQCMRNASERELQEISGHVQARGVFINRTRASIESFLRDLSREQPSLKSSFRRLSVSRIPSGVHRLRPSQRIRDLGSTPFTRRKIKDFANTLGPSLSFIGASGDVQTVAWARDNQTFAIGCAALMDDSSQQYNQKNNLLIGDIFSKTLRELPDHAKARKRTLSGINSTIAMHNVQDPLIYSSISTVYFSPDADAMFSAGYDEKVIIWDLRDHEASRNSMQNAARCAMVCRHKAPVDLVAVRDGGLFATASQRSTQSIKVLKYDLDEEDVDSLKRCSLSSPRAAELPDKGIMPSCLRWGYDKNYQQDYLGIQNKYLAVGFSSWSSEAIGQFCVWDLSANQPVMSARGTTRVFDIAWSPSSFGRIAIGQSPQGMVNRGTRSVVRIFDSRFTPSSPGLNMDQQRAVELECPALDMNDVVFNPENELLISAGCTDNAVYTWDLRNPDTILHTFKHGKSLMEHDDSRLIEEQDTGLRFLSWHQQTRLMYTGSSDGVVASWNPYLSPENAHVHDLAHFDSGVMSGAFDHDFCNLLIGEVNGSVTVLSPGHEGTRSREVTKFKLQGADRASLIPVLRRAGLEAKPDVMSESLGTETSRSMLDKGEMKTVPFGNFPVRQAVQGPNYEGPYDTSPGAETLREASATFQSTFRAHKGLCTLDHAFPRLTEEEQGDSNVSQTRIPERFRWPALTPPTQKQEIGKVTDGTEMHVICFRCNTNELIPVLIDGGITDILRCTHCLRAWRYDVLGYTLIDYNTLRPLPSHPLLDDCTVVDETESADDLPAYYHSQWTETI